MPVRHGGEGGCPYLAWRRRWGAVSSGHVRAWRNGRRKGLEDLSAPGETRDVELPKVGETGHRQSRAKRADSRGRREGVETRRGAPVARSRYGEGIVQTPNAPDASASRPGGESRSGYENPSVRKDCAGSSPAARTKCTGRGRALPITPAEPLGRAMSAPACSGWDRHCSRPGRSGRRSYNPN